MVTVVGAHAAGELNEIITGGVRDVPGRTMFEKMQYLETKADDLRQFLLNEPRGRVNQCVNLVLPPTHPEADADVAVIVRDEDSGEERCFRIELSDGEAAPCGPAP